MLSATFDITKFLDLSANKSKRDESLAGNLHWGEISHGKDALGVHAGIKPLFCSLAVRRRSAII